MNEERNFVCRFHPFNWWHEVGCPHMEWTPEELAEAEKVRENGRKKYGGGVLTEETVDGAEDSVGPGPT